MGLSLTYVIARWDRPLVELQVSSALINLDIDEGFSWHRPDGWQCLTPTEFYDRALLPPVLAIQDEVGGPVLGMGVESSSEWELAFVLDGELQRFARYPGESESDEAHEAEMTSRWGADWLTGVSEGLRRWAAPFADVDASAVRAALAAPHVWAQGKLADLQRVLTLVPPLDDRWWDLWSTFAVPDAEVPGSRYAVNAVALSIPGLLSPERAFMEPSHELALVWTDSGFGIWDRDPRTWARDPFLSLDAAVDELAALLPARGWRAE